MNEKIILVNRKDEKIGVGEKLKVHREGKLHRAFSIFVFNSKKELLIQQRANSKYHSAGLWGNTCCSHPIPDEGLKETAEKRLKDEMGIKCKLKEVFNFIYKTKVGNLIEYEFDHVFLGKFDGILEPNKKEVQNWKWIKIEDLKEDIKKNPQKYAPWLKIGLKKIKIRSVEKILGVT